MHRMLALGATALAAVTVAAPASGQTDGFPARPLRMIVPFAPGGASDFVGRIVQPPMSELLKQQIVVDNRGGAAGNIGVEVAVKATPDGHTFLLGNEVQMMFVTFSSAVNFAKQGRVRMLGVVSPERNPALPDVPTMREQGFDMVVGSWQGIFVPKGTPKGVVDRLFTVGVQMMKDPMVVKRMSEGGVTIVSSKSPADFTAFVKAETERYGKVMKDAGITGE